MLGELKHINLNNQIKIVHFNEEIYFINAFNLFVDNKISIQWIIKYLWLSLIFLGKELLSVLGDFG